MREVFTMWRYTQMVVLVALSAAIYAAVLIPFKGFPLVPGYIELRPANAFPIVFGLLFGPAGAWGAAIGNLIGDFFGTLTLGSVGGFVGNFFLALLPYKIWSTFFRRDENMETNVDSGKKLGVYIAAAILASTVCAVIISWWVDLLGLAPFLIFLASYSANNAILRLCWDPISPARSLSSGEALGAPVDRDKMEPEEVWPRGLRGTGRHPWWVGAIGRGSRGPGPRLHRAGPWGPWHRAGTCPVPPPHPRRQLMLGGREQVEAIQEETMPRRRIKSLKERYAARVHHP
jgi:energy-coupling factor transport system substrate-specific component